MKIFIICLIVFIGFVPVSDAYEWHIYNGHSYTLTNGWSNWVAAEKEAAELSGHLVTINDDEENTWLKNTFKDVYVRSGLGDPWQNIAWIGYYYDTSSGAWKWISEEPVTYYAYYSSWPQGGTVAYLHLAYHPGGAGTWNANPTHNEVYGSNPKGIIEVPRVITEPTPTTTTPTPTVAIPKINKRAKLKASYEIGSNNNRIEISVKIYNEGDATASFIEAIINNPAELDPRLIYGGEQTGSIITWSGDLAPGEMHEIKYSTAVVKDKDIRVPIEIKYAKMSGAEKAQMLGMVTPSNMESAKALMTEDDWDKLDSVIVILKSLSKLQGFEILFGIVGVCLIYIIKKLRNRI